MKMPDVYWPREGTRATGAHPCGGLRRRLLVGTILCPVLAPLMVAPAVADEFDLEGPVEKTAESQPVTTNEVSVGVGYQNETSTRYGKYSGRTEEGMFGTGNFTLQGRATGKDEGTFYYRAEGEDFDILSNRLTPTSATRFQMGEQGAWGAKFSYEGIVSEKTSNFHSLFNNDGSLANGLTANSIYTGSDATEAASAVARVNQYLTTLDIGTRRDRFAGEYSQNLSSHWKLTGRLEHEHKEGDKINSMMFIDHYNFASFAEPVDYDTDRYSLSAAYTTKPFQASLSYSFSNFTNNQTEYQTENPFYSVNARTGATLTNRDGTSETSYSLPPSNSEHSVKGTAGVNLTDTTRVTSTLRYGLQLQNDTYYARSNEVTALDSSHYDGRVENMYGTVALISRPLSDWNFRAAYTVDSRDNKSGTYTTTSHRGETDSQTWGMTTAIPYSFIYQTSDLEASYRVMKGTKVSLDYQYKDKIRSRSVTNRNQESTVGGKIQSQLSSSVSGTLGYSHSERQATAYDGNKGWAEMGLSASESALAMYSYAARSRDEYRANLNWNATDQLSLGWTARYDVDEYPSTYYGVTDDHMITVGPDVSFSPSKDVTTHFYYNYQQIFSHTNYSQAGRTDSVDWSLDNQDSVHTVGVRGEWQVNDRLKLSAQNNLSYGNTAFEESSYLVSGTLTDANTAVDLPTVKSLTNALQVSGEYKVAENVTMSLTGIWERFLYNDYLDEQSAASTSNTSATVALDGDGDASYDVGVVLLTTKVTW